MNDETRSAQDDLAFMRALAAGTGTDFFRHFGQAYCLAGLCYSLQMLGHAAQLELGWFSTPVSGTALGLGPTAVFLVLLTWLNRRHGRIPGNTAVKAIGAVFGAVGLANLVLAAVIGLQAWRMQSLQVWLIYPCVVMALQGMAWMVAWILRRRGWMGLVALGWFATAVGMAFLIPSQAGYIAVLGVGMLLFMLAPGAVLMRLPKA